MLYCICRHSRLNQRWSSVTTLELIVYKAAERSLPNFIFKKYLSLLHFISFLFFFPLSFWFSAVTLGKFLSQHLEIIVL